MGARSHSAAQGRKVGAGAHPATASRAGGTWKPIVPQQQVRPILFCRHWLSFPNSSCGKYEGRVPDLMGIWVWVGERELRVSSFEA